MRPLQLDGQIFGRLTVLQRAQNDKAGRTKWRCECRCGKLCTVSASCLQKGNTTSCGCLNSELARQRGFDRVPHKSRLKKGSLLMISAPKKEVGIIQDTGLPRGKIS